jgi:hypothetical protein
VRPNTVSAQAAEIAFAVTNGIDCGEKLALPSRCRCRDAVPPLVLRTGPLA